MQDTNNVKHLRVHFLCKGASNRISYYIKVYTFKLCKNILKILPKQDKLREKVLQKFGRHLSR